MAPVKTYKKRVYRRKRTTKRYFPKKKFGKKFSKKRVTFGGLPDSKFMKLKYVDYAPKATAGAGVLTMDVRYRLNSPYDPNFTTGTGQISAQMFNTWATFYQQYQVYGCKIIQECWNYDTVTPINFHSIVSNQIPNWVVGADRRVLEMNRWCQTKTASPLGSGRNMIRFKRYIKLRALAGITKAQFQGNQFAAYVAANPLDQMYGVVCADPIDVGDANGAPYQIKTTLIFYTKMFDKVPITSTLQVDTDATINSKDVAVDVYDTNENKTIPP